MVLPLTALLSGIALLIWSAGRFVEASAAIARHFGMPPLLIGMVIVGFGTSSPELLVSVLAALEDKAGIALGNAYGSNIANIALILGLTALISPIAASSAILRKELPMLAAVTALAAWQLRDDLVSRADALTLLGVFALVMGWSIRQGLAGKADTLGAEIEQELDSHPMPLRTAYTWLAIGLLLLIASSRLLVWGAVEIARGLGVSDLIIGLTVVAAGTSLPELASSIIAARKGEHDIALGNVLGSNLFNTLGVVGLAALITPVAVGPEVLGRDVMVMSILTLSLFAICYGWGRPGRVNRYEGGGLLICYLVYMAYLVSTVFSH